MSGTSKGLLTLCKQMWSGLLMILTSLDMFITRLNRFQETTMGIISAPYTAFKNLVKIPNAVGHTLVMPAINIAKISVFYIIELINKIAQVIIAAAAIARASRIKRQQKSVKSDARLQ